MLSGSLPPQLRARGVTAVLGPTNTGKTHLAIERMLGHSSGLIGLPLRLLAREVYNRVVDRVGKDKVALITGEEKIKPKHARYWVSTVEAMPRDLDTAFLAVDEIQIAADLDRGHVFTNAMLNMRGSEETLIIGSSTMKPLVEKLLPGADIVSRPRLSKLSFAGERKITRLPPRSAIVAFSAEEVYAIAELIRRQRGGAAVVMGALSPRTRNAQVELFQNGDVDHIVATDAIGMGLNLEIDHVAFAADRKFDGYMHRRLNPAEMAQIAGRAGRHLKDGTFGTSARCPPFEPDLIEQLENHDFDAVRIVNWRNPELDFASLAALQASLGVSAQELGVMRAPTAADEHTLAAAASRPEIAALASTPAAVRKLWEVCALPDYRKVAPQHHADLVTQIYEYVMRGEFIPVDWFAGQVALCNRSEGEIDTLSARLAQIRTWTFCANRVDWLRDPEHWQRVTRKVEDTLSDALHEKLTARFVDRRTSVLMRRLRENAMLEAEVNANGDVLVEGQNVGKLSGFRFTADTQGMGVDTPEAKALRTAAAKSLMLEMETRATKFAGAEDAAFALALDGTIRWQGEPVAKLQPGEKTLEPRALILADEQLAGAPREQVEARLALFLKAHVTRLLGPLLALEAGETLAGIGRGIAYQLAEHLGVLDRASVAGDVKTLDQPGRSELRKLGVRFGSYHLYLPLLLKPAARALAAQLWMLKHGGSEAKGLDDIVHLASSGRTSFPADESLPKGLYRAAGFSVCGPRAVRIDILERLADIIRPAIAFKPGLTPGNPPPGATEGDGFTVTVGMTSLVGCSGEDFAAILKSLNYRSEKKPPPAPKPIVPLPGSTPVTKAAEAPSEPSIIADETVAEPIEAVPDVASGPEALHQAETATDLPEASVEEHAGIIVEEPALAADAAEPVIEDDASRQTEETGVEADAEPNIETAPAPELAADAAVLHEGAAAEPETAVPEIGPEPVEPVLIEVWRPSRFERSEGQRPNRQKRGRDGRTDSKTDGKADSKTRDGNTDGARQGRQLWVRDPSKPAPEPKPAAEPRVLWTRDMSAPAAKRPDRAPENGKRPPRRDGDHRRDEHKRDDHRRDGQRFQKPMASMHSAPRAEKQADPDSPFAKLAALKSQLEGKS